MKKSAYSGILILICCCTPKLSPPTSEDAERGKTSWNNCSLEKLTEAHSLFVSKCGTCHALKPPVSQSEESWKKIVPPMAKKARLNPEEQDLILHYVLTMRQDKK